MSEYSIERKIQCIKREIGLRQRVYPARVQAGKMTHSEATDELAVLQDILRDYLERAQLSLFPSGKES